jgi:hypothetical protein
MAMTTDDVIAILAVAAVVVVVGTIGYDAIRRWRLERGWRERKDDHE